ncbi:MAG TPA: hypothetical protein EYP40_08165 [Chromatiales bacterium]|nr:hypothetical protein [Chromatiales bacterium]
MTRIVPPNAIDQAGMALDGPKALHCRRNAEQRIPALSEAEKRTERFSFFMQNQSLEAMEFGGTFECRGET